MPRRWFCYGSSDPQVDHRALVLLPGQRGFKIMKNTRKKAVFVDGADYPTSFADAVIQFERTFLVQSLWSHKGNVSHTAITLGVTRRTLQVHIKAARINATKIRRESRELFEQGVFAPVDVKRYIRRGRK